MLLYGNVVELLPRIASPCVECDEEIEAEAEAGLEDDEALAVLPALRQAVALQEDVFRLRRAAGGAVIHVAEGLRIRDFVQEAQGGGNDRGRHGPILRQVKSRPRRRGRVSAW